MNMNQFTQKSLAAIQGAQDIALEHGNQQIEQPHLLMALVGFFCAVVLPDFKQFSLLYLVLAVFITTPVFLAGQLGIEAGWIKFHPMYHLFLAMKRAYFEIPNTSLLYYAACGASIFLLFLLAGWGLRREMARKG